MRILVAPDKFKGTLTAHQAAHALASGIRRSNAGADVVEFPVADGGEGSHEVLIRAGFQEVPVRVRGADGVEHLTSYARKARVAVLELARLCGSATLACGPNPWHANTFGLGEAIGHACADGAERIIICIGGSASIDGGTGMLAALGYTFFDSHDRQVEPALASLASIARVRPPSVERFAQFTMVCDVSTSLLGPEGGVRQFSIQKGLSPDHVAKAESAMSSWVRVAQEQTGIDVHERPGTGSAGGVGFAAFAYLQADYLQGLEFFDEALGFSDLLRGADAVVTGEGTFDRGSFGGKTPVGVAERTRLHRKLSVLVAGQILVGDSDLGELYDKHWSISDEVGLDASLGKSGSSLELVGAAVGEWLLTR